MSSGFGDKYQGTHENSIVEGASSDGQRKEELGNLLVIVLGVDSCTSRRILKRSEVGNAWRSSVGLGLGLGGHGLIGKAVDNWEIENWFGGEPCSRYRAAASPKFEDLRYILSNTFVIQFQR